MPSKQKEKPSTKLQDISKLRYRKHLNIVIVSVILLLIATSLASSTLLIYLFGVDGNNFKFNLVGVVIAVSVVFGLLKVLRYEPFLYEVMYVWELKKSINLINRRLNKVIEAVETGDAEAMQALNYCYQASRQLYTLDDNTINMAELEEAIVHLQDQAKQASVKLELSAYDPRCLVNYR
ncbi:DUF3087 family protein [Sinobacterium caligoides]|uniref:DUF3087 family protein n=1 Tax=Sinobacterium caligoides TaxID=933926 RepID=A0A3N2DY76_9GAMM|nr:DUF3087 family protein [Sinobacterium caligoides]ROS04826.1 DUF3087 family protein [Sinobacterium caligoides]